MGYPKKIILFILLKLSTLVLIIIAKFGNYVWQPRITVLYLFIYHVRRM